MSDADEEQIAAGNVDGRDARRHVREQRIHAFGFEHRFMRAPIEKLSEIRDFDRAGRIRRAGSTARSG